ncbi:MAG TPA: alkaline phosphatase family protein [Gemmataceae bacterium]|jgi:DNA-binding beta-propeller fold protein YncE
MHRRSLAAALLLTGTVAGLSASLSPGRDDPPAPAALAPPPRVLPGIQTDGFVQLPNQWRLRPAGSQLQLGDFPVNIAVHPDGRYLAILHCGWGDHEIVVVDLDGRPRIVSRATIEQGFYGLAFAPDGRRLFASGGEYADVHAFDFRGGYLSNHRRFEVAVPRSRSILGGLAVSPDGKTLAVADTFGNSVILVPLDAPDQKRLVSLGPPGKELPAGIYGPMFRTIEGMVGRLRDMSGDGFPYACLFDSSVQAGGPPRLFVSLWNKAAVAVIDPAEGKVVATWPTEAHPTEMAIRHDGKALYVACSNSTKVSVIDPSSGKPLQTLACALYPTAPTGNTPNSLALTPDGAMLFVANADANNVAVFNVADRDDARPLGFIPVGWYPTSVRFNPADKHLYIANGKGNIPKSNRSGPSPFRGERGILEHIAGLLRGTLSTVPLPSPEQMARYSRQAYACSPLKRDASPVGTVPANNPIPAKVGDPSPIKYVIYIVKENRTYDQVFGDMKDGNGEPDLCIFPEDVTPNHHALAREFVLLDNTYADGEVSADGHEWSMGAYATDFVEKLWPIQYRAVTMKKLGYPAEGYYESVAHGAGGYLWDRCAEAGVSYRSYGEWVANGKTPEGPTLALSPALVGHIDPRYQGFDLDWTDQKRADRFISEFHRLDAAGQMPRLQIVRLPNDHTTGTRVGKPTPQAMVADNDFALGRIVETVSRSKYWPETAIFIIEDDAQNGPDHVDAHRTVAMLVSPYVKRGAVDSTMYSTTSLLRTMGLILGTKSMSQFDAAARPMYNSFRSTPDARPYTVRPPRVNLNAKNTQVAWGADLSEKFDLTKEDRADDLLFNEVIWRSVKGANSPMPAPVRAAWVFPHVKKEDD